MGEEAMKPADADRRARRARELYQQGLSLAAIAAAIDAAESTTLRLIHSPAYGTDDLPSPRRRRRASLKMVNEVRQLMTRYWEVGSYSILAEEVGRRPVWVWQRLNASLAARELHDRGEAVWIGRRPFPPDEAALLAPPEPRRTAAPAVSADVGFWVALETVVSSMSEVVEGALSALDDVQEVLS